MWGRLREISRLLPGDVRVVVVKGEGRSFSAGLDLSAGGGRSDANAAGSREPAPPARLVTDLARMPRQEALAAIAAAQEAFSWLRRPDLITIARVQGHAIGAGLQLALACDIRVLGQDARLAMAEVTLGLVPDLGGTKRLVELVGYGRALEMCATGRWVEAAEAQRIGLANLVVPVAELDGAVQDLTAAVLAGHRDAVIEIKALLAGAAARSYADQERAEREAQHRRLRDLAGLDD